MLGYPSTVATEAETKRRESADADGAKPDREPKTAAAPAPPSERVPVDRVEHPEAHSPISRADLTETERRLLGDLFAIVEEHVADAAVAIERPRVEDAFLFACEHHADQRRQSGEDFIVHPVGVAKICAGHAAGHRDAVRGAAARHGRGHQRVARGGPRALRRRDRPRSSTA